MKSKPTAESGDCGVIVAMPEAVSEPTLMHWPPKQTGDRLVAQP